MSKQEATIQAVQTLYARLDILRQMKVSDMLYPGQQTKFEQTLEEAYAELAKIETELDELGDRKVLEAVRARRKIIYQRFMEKKCRLQASSVIL